MTSIITNTDQATPPWLTAVLRESGALRAGRVVSTQAIGDVNREWSSSRRLSLSYAAGSDGRCPPALFLEVVKMLVDDDVILPSEVDYYRRDYVGLDGVPLVPCYGAGYDSDVGYYYVLLEDVTDTHVNQASRCRFQPMSREVRPWSRAWPSCMCVFRTDLNARSEST